jgi:hypothetical protein
MPFLEYVLLALLGSAGGATPAGTPARTLTADAVTQPSGSTEGLFGQVLKGKVHGAARRRPRGHKRSKVTGTGSKVSSSTGAQAELNRT